MKITDHKSLELFIAEKGDYHPGATFLAQNLGGECFALYSCTHASEAFKFMSDEFGLVITYDNYAEEIAKQERSSAPESSGFSLREEV